MNGIDFLADTNFLIYLLEGRPEAELFADYTFAISFVTEIEMLGRKGIPGDEKPGGDDLHFVADRTSPAPRMTKIFCHSGSVLS